MSQETLNLKVAESLGRIENKIDMLIGPDGALSTVRDRVKNLETDRTRNWWFTIIFAPILAAVQATMRHFGINV